MRFIFILLSLISFLGYSTLIAQTPFPLADDPLYWQNRKPNAAYWQQDVAYKIKATIDEEKHTVSGTEALNYWNNSPDTLYFVYFHLFQNAFVKDAYTRQLEKHNKVKARLGKYEAAGLGTVTSDIKVDGQIAKTELDNTILKVYLPQPMLPNTAIQITMNFTSYWDNGSTRRRMKMYDAWGFQHYNGCQWFPKLAVYDAKFGWDTYQHLGKEFYGDFGVYDVTLDFPSNYIVEATGVLQNRNEVLPPDLREKIDIKHFKDKPWEEVPSIIIPYQKGERKQWHFIANHVHDFAFTADPSYRIETTYRNGVECVGLVQEPHASGWVGSSEFVADIIEQLGNQFGTYHYPKMIAADAADGMEYPMITLDGGRNPGYRGLLVHEIAHNWYYGMVGSNETYRAGLDEGFTQYMTAEGLKLVDGDTMKENISKKWVHQNLDPKNPQNVRVLAPYVYSTASGGDHQLNTHSDDFGGALHHGGGYSNVYYKTAAMLYSLKYVLGDSLFDAAMLHYFHQWKFAHPYFEDFRNSITQYTKVDLNWFFDQWWETTKPLNYSIKKIKNNKAKQTSTILLQRRGYSMQMPIDLRLIHTNNDTSFVHIPNTWFEKETKAQILPRWTGWGYINTNYEAVFTTQSPIRSVSIFPSNTVADFYMLNNTKSTGWCPAKEVVKVKLDRGIAAEQDWTKYRAYWRPDVWYNGVDGLKIGAQIEGSYLRNILKIDAAVWYNTTLGRWFEYLPEWNETIYKKYAPVNYRVNFSTPIVLTKPELTLQLGSRFVDGFWKHQGGFNWEISKSVQVGVNLQTQYGTNTNSLDYLLYQNEWSSFANKPNTTLGLQLQKTYKGYKSSGYWNLQFRTPMLNNHFDYSYVQFENKFQTVLDKFILRTRVFARYGRGTHVPNESALFLAMASPETYLENKFMRSQMIVPDEWQGYSPYNTNHLHYAGGLNLRGYAGYYAYDERNGQQYLAYKGRSGASVNAELDFSRYFNWKPSFFKNWLNVQTYIFADAGIIELSDYKNADYNNTIPTNYVSDFRFDAGIGAAFTIKKWGNFAKAKPLTIRFDMPIFLNRPTFSESQYFAARWLMGIGFGL